MPAGREPSMSEAPQELKRINWSDCFSFVRVFRSFRYALQPVALLLSFFAVVLTYGAGRLLDMFWVETSQPAVTHSLNELLVFITNGGDRAATSAWAKSLGDPSKLDHAGIFALLLNHVLVSANHLISAVLSASPAGILAALKHAVLGMVWLVTMHPLYAVLFGLLTLAIWSFLGGAVCRATAVLATREERITLGEAISFAKTRVLAFFTAPLLPLIMILVAGAVLTFCGLVGKIPLVGDILIGLLFFVAIALGMAIAFFAVILIAGCGLTFPTIAVEGSDAFDALSRTGAYIFFRPWKAVLYFVSAIVHGAICIAFVKVLARLMFWAIGTFGGVTLNWAKAYVPEGQRPGIFESVWQPPTLMGDTPFYGSFDGPELSHVSVVTKFFLQCWVYGVWALVAAIAINYFFAANTIIYLLLRREEDLTDIEDVYMEDMPDAPAAAPAVEASKPGGSGGTSLPVIG